MDVFGEYAQFRNRMRKHVDGYGPLERMSDGYWKEHRRLAYLLECAGRSADKAARNIAVALIQVCTAAACGIGPDPYFRVPKRHSFFNRHYRGVLGEAGLWKERG